MVKRENPEKNNSKKIEKFSICPRLENEFPEEESKDTMEFTRKSLINNVEIDLEVAKPEEYRLDEAKREYLKM